MLLLGEQILTDASAAEAVRTINARDLKTVALVKRLETDLAVGHFAKGLSANKYHNE